MVVTGILFCTNVDAYSTIGAELVVDVIVGAMVYGDVTAGAAIVVNVNGNAEVDASDVAEV